MRILIDMDDVLTTCVSVWIDFLNKKSQKNICYEQIDKWDMKEIYPELSLEEILEPLGLEEFWNKVVPLKDSIKYVGRLYKLGHELVVVSASHPLSYCYKLTVLNKFFSFIPNDHIIIAHNKSFIGGDIMIDDNPKNLENNSCSYGILFTAPHNRNYEVDNKNIFRADTWEEAYRLVCHINEVS